VSRDPSFERNAREFADGLSSLLTRTITYQPLVCSFVGGLNVALVQFRPDPDVPEQRYVELENGCWVSVLQRVVPNPEDPDRVRTAAYSYSYSLGPDHDEEWLVRYDYVPERAAQEPEHPYPASHVHVNASNGSYDEFMRALSEDRPLSQVHFPTGRISLEDFVEHLLIEFRVPILYGRSVREALEILEEGREEFRKKRTS